MMTKEATGQTSAAPDRAPSPVMVLAAVALAMVGLGGLLYLVGQQDLGLAVWTLTTIAGIVPAAWFVAADVRHHRLGVDVVALLALVGTLAVAEPLAGAVITVMLATGRALEGWAGGRARRELGALLQRAPRSAHRYGGDGVIDVDLDAVVPGDLVLVKPGEVVPLDGRVERGVAVLDESALTGEALPVERLAGTAVRSGVANAGGPFDLRTTATAADSTYAGIVRLVAESEASSAPFVRLADRYAGLFLGLSILIAGAAWIISGDPVRAVAVLVVATPCPLILAAPVAIVSGLSAAARRGVIVKGGGALERLSTGTTLLFDKTGTLTMGHPELVAIIPAPGVDPDLVLTMAASLDQVSPHVLASAVVAAARTRGLALTLPVGAEEVPGQGISGHVGGHAVQLGKLSWAAPDAIGPWVRTTRRRAELDGAMTAFVRFDDRPIGALVLVDPIRPDAARTIAALRRDGIRRVVMVTGDRSDVAATIGTIIGVDAVLAERTPVDKVEAVRIEQRSAPTIMVGDGINDAPALALADVGVAVGARGATAASQAADVVLLVDRLDRVGDAVAIARRATGIARESVVIGIGLSIVAMGAAAAGFLAPVWGALLQEVIDLGVILNALRARQTPRVRPLSADAARLTRQFRGEHRTLRPDIDQLQTAADQLGTLDEPTSLAELRAVQNFLVTVLLPHEVTEEQDLYPAMAAMIGGVDPTGPMSRTHAEIAHRIRRFGQLLDDIGAEGPDEADVVELRRFLYGLHAILVLHFAQEDEGYLSLGDDDPLTTAPSA